MFVISIQHKSDAVIFNRWQKSYLIIIPAETIYSINSQLIDKINTKWFYEKDGGIISTRGGFW